MTSIMILGCHIQDMIATDKE